MGWRELVKKLFGPEDGSPSEEPVSKSDTGDDSMSLSLKLLIMASGIGYLAAGLLMCDWRTIVGGQDVRQSEYYRLNNAPNPNQNKAEFCHRLVADLCIDNEALILEVGGNLYLADSWNLEEGGTREDWYRNIRIDGDANRVYSRPASEVMHLSMSWKGLWPLLSEAAEEYQALISTACRGYANQAAEKGILTIGAAAQGDAKEMEYRNRLIQNQFKEFFSAKSSVLALRSGYAYTPHSTAHRNTSEMNDVANLSDEYAERVGLAIRVPPALLKGNSENTSHANVSLIVYGVKPIADQIEAEYGAKRLGRDRLLKGDRLHIDPMPIYLANPDTMANICERMTSCGQYSVDELRSARGEPLLGTPEAQKHYITKNYGELGHQDDPSSGQAATQKEE